MNETAVRSGFAGFGKTPDEGHGFSRAVKTHSYEAFRP
jgi:hypothetical protein